jgi:hypothetical protein
VPITYLWSDIINLARLRFAKGLPADATMQAQLCDLVSAEMWRSFPWRASRSSIASGLIALVDGTQDYSVPTNFYRLTKASLCRTDTTPDEHRELAVADDIPINLTKASPYNIRQVSHQADAGMLRLEQAVQIASGTTWELRGEYQRLHSKVTTTASNPWFDDMHQGVAIEGLLYQFYKLSDDDRAGGVVKVEHGRASFAGQYAAFRAGIDMMAAAEEYGGNQTLFPDSPMGATDVSGLAIFG